MKKVVSLALLCLSVSSLAQAQMRPGPGRGDGRPGNDFEVRECRIKLDNARMETQALRDRVLACESRGNLDQLIAENRDLKNQNLSLLNDNALLRDQVEKLRIDNSRLQDEVRGRREEENRRPIGFFSYAGCKTYNGVLDLKYIASAEGTVPLMSETNAKQQVTSKFSCSYGIINGKTEEIRDREAHAYCVAGCADYQGNVDQKYLKSSTGRNKTEAEYNAIKAVGTSFSCSYGIKVQACQ
jgi:hypothetical protein